MKSRNHLHATIRNLKLSRNNWRNKYEGLLDKHKIARNAVKALVYEVAQQELRIKQLEKQVSKQYGWQAYREKYGHIE